MDNVLVWCLLAAVVYMGVMTWVLSNKQTQIDYLTTENELLIEKAMAQEKALTNLKAMYEMAMAALSEREKLLDQLDKERETVRERFRQVVNNDKTSHDWSAQSVPDRVRDLLVNTSGSKTGSTNVPVCPR